MPDTCKHCGSDKIIPDVIVVDHASVGNIPYDAELQVRLEGDRRSEPLHARVCGACGNVELWLQNAQELYRRYMQSKNS